MTSVRRPLLRPAMAAAGLALAGLLLSACGGATAGAAATLGDERISEQQLTAQVQEVLVAQGKAPDTTDASLTSQTLSRMIIIDLVQTLADRNGIVIDQGAIDRQMQDFAVQMGSPAEVEKTLAGQGIAPSQIETVIRLNLQAQALGLALDPQGTADEQGTAVFAAVNELSNELGVTASPRFGTWDPTALNVGASPTDLAAPPALG